MSLYVLNDMLKSLFFREFESCDYFLLIIDVLVKHDHHLFADLFLGNRKGAHQERVKLNRSVRTLQTIKSRPILPVQVVNDYWSIPFQKIWPLLFSHYLLLSSIIVFVLNVGFLLNSVQIFMKSIKEVSNQFTRIVLIVAEKNRLIVANFPFKLRWRNISFRRAPHSFHETGISCWESSLCS